MAEGGQVSGRREELKRNCSPCSDKGKENAAAKYCFMCEASFCKDCTEQHNALLSKHRVTEIESVNIRVPMTLQTEPCPQHGKALTLYCTDDDLICCDECFSTDHLSCKEVVYLPISAKDITKNIDETEIKSKLRRCIEQLGSIRINQQKTVASLGADREKCLKELDDHHTELLDLLEKVVQSSKDQIEQTFECFSADLQRHQKEVEKCLVDLESSEKCIERKHGNDFTVYVELKRCQIKLNATEVVSKEALENLKSRCFSVALDGRLHVLLSEIELLVTVLKQAPAKMRKTYTIDVSVKEDTVVCRMLGSCILNDGSILLADVSNKMLKCVDKDSLKVKDQCLMNESPIDVCVINDNEVAITQGNKTVVIVAARPNLTPIRTISMDKHCAFVAYSKEELFVTDQKKAEYIYNMEGSIVRTISTDTLGQELFSQIRHIMVSASGDEVYIADQEKGTFTLDRKGQVQNKLVSEKIRSPQALCMDGMGGLFVCGYYSKNVVHVSADGQILTEVLTSSDGLLEPLSVCFDKLRRRLIVTQNNSHQIRACELE